MCYTIVQISTFIFFSIIVSFFLLFFKLVEVNESISCRKCLHDDNSDEYDFIVVGAGTAGSTVAGLLAKNTKYKILVLEAGSNGPSFLDIPFIGPLLQGTGFDWQYETVPQNNACLAFKNQVSKWPAGKIVGGTSRLNNMLYVRGHDEDYADWFSSIKDYKSKISKIFKNIETYLPINNLLYSSLLGDVFLQSGFEAGYKYNNTNLGFHKVKVNQMNGARKTTGHIYLSNPSKYPSLTLLTNSIATKLLIKNSFVYGVKFIKGDKTYIKRSRKAVILSAGVIGTPKLLMLSGIGPSNHLQKFDIQVIKNLPVGKNLQDHITTGIDLVMVNSSLNMGLLDMLSPKTVVDYILGNGGPWSSPGCEAMAFFNTSSHDLNDNTQPDLQLMAMPLGVTKDAGAHFHNLFGILSNIWNNYFHELSNNNMISILPVVLHPKSRGTVELSSNDYRDKPLVDPQYLTHKTDVDILIKGIRIIQQLINTPSMQKIGAKIVDKHFPGCEKFDFDTDDYWECYVRHMTLTSFHPAGTCKMGLYEDFDTVVDKSTLKVKGFKNLIIADASVFPNLPSGNINAAVILIAEKAVEYILETRDFENYDYQTCHIKHVFVHNFKCAVKNLFY